MKSGVIINGNVIIPEDELIITASRAGGPGGQHVNKTSSRVTVRWNVLATEALSDEQKERVLQKLKSQLTAEGDIVLHYGASRSQQQNKKAALELLVEKIKKALFVPKKRISTKVSARVKEKRLQAKRMRSAVKRERAKKNED